MNTISISFDIGRDADLRKIKAKTVFRQLRNDNNFLFTKIGEIFVILFKSGKIRLVHENRTFESLKKSIPLYITELKDLTSKIVSAAGIRADVEKIISKSERDSEEEFYLPIKRSTLGDMVGSEVFNELAIIAPSEILSDYQKERLLTQAGENLGRKVATGKKTRKELENSIVGYLKDQGIGSAVVEKGEKERSGRTPHSVVRVYESIFSYGAVPIGSGLCSLIRGFIRGAYCKYLNAENINVEEVRCWGLGDVFCEFRVYILT